MQDGVCPRKHFGAVTKLKDLKHRGLSAFPSFSAPGMFLQPRISPCSSLLERTPRAIPSPVGFSWKHSSGIPVHGRVSRGLRLTFRSKGQEGQLRASFGDREPGMQMGPTSLVDVKVAAYCRCPFSPAPSLVSLFTPHHSEPLCIWPAGPRNCYEEKSFSPSLIIPKWKLLGDIPRWVNKQGDLLKRAKK